MIETSRAWTINFRAHGRAEIHPTGHSQATRWTHANNAALRGNDLDQF